MAFLAAPLVTSAVVGIGVAVSGGGSQPLDLSRYASDDLASAAGDHVVAERAVGVSRDTDRQAVTALIDPKVAGRLWTTAALDLRATPDQDARVLGEMKAVSRVRVTGQQSGDYAQVLVRDEG